MKSVRPIEGEPRDICPNEMESDADEEAEVEDRVGSLTESCEIVRLERDDDVVRRIWDPKMPPKEEVDALGLSGHLPYRNWCPVCIAANWRDLDHSKDQGKERMLPDYSWDSCSPGDELGFKWAVLVGRERGSKSRTRSAIPMHGGRRKCATDKCLECIDEHGDRKRDLIVKTDQEPIT